MNTEPEPRPALPVCPEPDAHRQLRAIRKLLRWNDTGAMYVHPVKHTAFFTLADAMRLADYQALTVVHSGTGAVVWIGSEATR